jgi:hypothetical protein
MNVVRLLCQTSWGIALNKHYMVCDFPHMDIAVIIQFLYDLISFESHSTPWLCSLMP